MSALLPDGRWSGVACAIAAVLYGLTAGVVLVNRLRHDRRRRLRQTFEQMLLDEEHGPVTVRSRLAGALDDAPLSTLRYLITERALSPALRGAVAQALLARLGEPRILEDVESRGGDGWRRIVALHILAHAQPVRSLGPLRRALARGHLAVANEAILLLGQMRDPEAADVLIHALAERQATRSRIATALDGFPIDIPDRIVPMLASDEPLVRYWGAMLMRRYGRNPGADVRLEKLTRDRDALVRRAAVESIAAAGGPTAVAAARARLTDPVAFVRAHAARTLGALDALETVGAVLPLLADPDWWVRYAAKESLEAMGPGIAGAVIPYLSHHDAFARNSAAEVLQNIGAFERLLVEEASAPPDPQRLATLDLLARAGGAPMWDSVLERLDQAARLRARQVLAGFDLDGLSARDG